MNSKKYKAKLKKLKMYMIIEASIALAALLFLIAYLVLKSMNPEIPAEPTDAVVAQDDSIVSQEIQSDLMMNNNIQSMEYTESQIEPQQLVVEPIDTIMDPNSYTDYDDMLSDSIDISDGDSDSSDKLLELKGVFETADHSKKFEFKGNGKYKGYISSDETNAKGKYTIGKGLKTDESITIISNDTGNRLAGDIEYAPDHITINEIREKLELYPVE